MTRLASRLASRRIPPSRGKSRDLPEGIGSARRGVARVACACTSTCAMRGSLYGENGAGTALLEVHRSLSCAIRPAPLSGQSTYRGCIRRSRSVATRLVPARRRRAPCRGRAQRGVSQRQLAQHPCRRALAPLRSHPMERQHDPVALAHLPAKRRDGSIQLGRVVCAEVETLALSGNVHWLAVRNGPRT